MTSTQPFLEAVKEGDRPLVEKLIAREPSLVDATTAEGLSAVLLAIYYEEPAIAELLIARGAQLDVFAAAATGRIDRVKALLDEQLSLVNAIAPDGFQPLGLASFFGHAPVVALLLSRGADVNAASRNAQRVTPLHSAVAAKHLEIVQLLLEHGAEVNVQQADDYTPLHGAAHNGQLDMVDLLLAYGADRSASKADGQSALSIALRRGHMEVAALLQQ